MELNSIKEAINDLKKGKLIILLDNKDRENEGDLIGAASLVTPQTINFMVTHARGAFIVVFMPEKECNRLNLPYMISPRDNKESNKTPFRITCDTAYGTTGSSTIDRAKTVNILGGMLKKYTGICDKGEVIRKSEAEDLIRPGHVQPISSVSLNKRQGHTDAGVELMKLAKFNPPCAVDLEIVNPLGEMAKEEYLYAFARQYGLKIIHISQLIDYLTSINSVEEVHNEYYG